MGHKFGYSMLLSVVLLALALCVIFGCSSHDEIVEKNPIVKPDHSEDTEHVPDNEPEPAKHVQTIPGSDNRNSSVENEDEQELKETVVPNTVLENIVYYTVDSASAEVKALNALIIGGDVKLPWRIVELVLNSLADESIEVNILSVIINDEVCVIDFDDSIQDVASMGAGIENAVLDAFAQSMLDNFDDCGSVIFRINSKPYKTKNNSFGLNQIYMDD